MLYVPLFLVSPNKSVAISEINPELIAVSPLNRFSVDLRTMVHNTRPMALTEISEPEENSRVSEENFLVGRAPAVADYM